MPNTPQPSDRSVYVDFDSRTATALDGVFPVVSWFDADGDECEPEDALACVAGPDNDGLWMTIDLSQKAPVSLH